MRIAFNIVGAVLRVFWRRMGPAGSQCVAWSFMSGQMRWAVRGGIAVVAGIALLVGANRKRQRA